VLAHYGDTEEWSTTNLDSDGKVMNGNSNDDKFKLGWDSRDKQNPDNGPRSEMFQMRL
jgi:hypothetical protein